MVVAGKGVVGAGKGVVGAGRGAVGACIGNTELGIFALGHLTMHLSPVE